MKNETLSHVDTKLNNSTYFSPHNFPIFQLKITNYLFCLRLKSEFLEHARETHSEPRSLIRQNMRATLRVVSCRVQPWGSRCGICGEQTGNEADFSEYFDFLQPIIIPSYTSIYLSLRGWAKSPSKAAVPDSHGNT